MVQVDGVLLLLLGLCNHLQDFLLTCLFLDRLLLKHSFSLRSLLLIFHLHHFHPLCVRELHLLDSLFCFLMLFLLELLPPLFFLHSHGPDVLFLFITTLLRSSHELLVSIHLDL